MKGCIKLAVCVAVLGLWLVAGCKKQAETQPADGVEESEKSAEAQKESQPVAGEQPSEGNEAAVAGTEEEVPQYVTDTVEHIKEINKLVKENIEDCSKAVEQIRGYLDKNQEHIINFQNAAMEAQAGMSPEQQSKLTKQMTRLMTPLMQETAKVQMEFTQKCQDEAKQISELMNKVQDIPKE